MRYSLWSHGRLVGHTDLDVYTVTSSMRQGFIEPTEEGKEILADATAVARALAEVKRAARVRRERNGDHILVHEAMKRREALNLQLRDETGAPFQFSFIRIYDNFDTKAVNDMWDTEEEEEAEFQIRLSRLSPEEQVRELARRAETNAEIDAMVAEVLEDREDLDDPPEDARWDTMQYLLQVHVGVPDWDDLDP